MGGGTILILVLSTLMEIEQHIAQGSNIIYFIPTSIIAVFVNTKQKLVNYKVGIIATIAGSISAGLGAKIASEVNSSNLRKYFGIFLGFIAVFEIKEYISKIKMHNKNKKEGRQ